jgi:hypothetical protein
MRSISMVFLYTASCGTTLVDVSASIMVIQTNHNIQSLMPVTRLGGTKSMLEQPLLTSPSCSTYRLSAWAPCGKRSWPGAVGTGLNIAAICNAGHSSHTPTDLSSFTSVMDASTARLPCESLRVLIQQSTARQAGQSEGAAASQ